MKSYSSREVIEILKKDGWHTKKYFKAVRD